MSAELFIIITIAAFLSALLYIILKFFERFNVTNIHGLTANYLTASLFSFFYTFQNNIKLLPHSSSYASFALGIGLLFICVFYTAAITAQKSGIAITSIAGKMSMVIPILFGVILYNDHITATRIIGMLVALSAVYLSSSATSNHSNTANKKNWIFPVLLFIGSGLVDTSIKAGQQYFMTEENQYLYFAFLFGSAGIFGVIASTYLFVRNRIAIQLKSILAGIILGIANFYSLVFLVKALANDGAESMMIFAISNVLVVLFSAIMGLLFFREKPHTKNLIGLVLAVIAILILTF
ncbi:MAG: EamA family transporter [Bacteroidota bacterium]